MRHRGDLTPSSAARDCQLRFLRARLAHPRHQSGADRYTTEIVLQKFRGELQMLESRGQGDGDRGGGRRDDDDYGRSNGRDNNRRDDRQSGSGGGGGYSRALDDDIPFAPEWR